LPVVSATLAPGKRTVTAAGRVAIRWFEAQALLCTDLAVTPAQIVAWFVLRGR